MTSPWSCRRWDARTRGPLVKSQLPWQHDTQTVTRTCISPFLAESAIGVGITTLYSATIVPLYSGTQVSQLVGIQLGHSVACFVVALLVAGVWQMAEILKDRRKR